MSEVVVAVVAVVIGWIVIGTQRVNEQLLVERRAAYQALLHLGRKPQLDSAERSRLTSTAGAATHGRELEEALTKAELVASRQLFATKALRALRDAGLTGGVPDAMREAFLELVREESIRNSYVLRKWHFHQYEQKYDITTLTPRAAHREPDQT